MKVRQMHEWKVLLAHIKGGLALYLKKIAVSLRFFGLKL
jgi:hypothetical protein